MPVNRSSGLSPESAALRSRIARMGALAQQAKYPTSETTRAAHKGFKAKFLRQVDPDGLLPEAERERRADAAMRLHMARLAHKSVKARQNRAQGESGAKGGEE
jgi:hypothetical protein